MKPAIKKLRTCTYSKDLVTSAAAFGQREQHTNKLVCDHPEMKLNWNEKVCGQCTVYENRNAQLVMPAPQSTQSTVEPPKTPTPASPKPMTPSPISSAPPAQAERPKKSTPKPASKSESSELAAVAPPAKTVRKAKSPAKEAHAATDTKVKSPAKPRAAKESPQKPTKMSATKPKQK